MEVVRWRRAGGGGGRYDHLIEELGGPPIPGVGFGLGIERLLLLLENKGIELEEKDRTDVFVAVIGDRARSFGLGLVRELRQSGVRAEMDTLERNIKGQFKYANRLHASKVVIIGENELETGKLQVKDMATAEQTEMTVEEVKALLINK